MNPDKSNQLCLECGLCCNGVIFADVQLQPEDDVRHLQSLGLPVTVPAGQRSMARETDRKSKITNPRFAQPCAAFDGCRCRIYSDRPKYCREFECLTLKQVKAGRLETTAALRVIRAARQRAEKVKHLLLELGDDDEHVALSQRFRRVKRRLESDLQDEETADMFSRLTLAVHDLNMLLSEAFYPGK
jgi:Fe-S-cluster containining protein